MAEFLSKSQVQVNAPQNDASVANLGKDLLSMFGAVGEGAKAINTAGDTAAKLEFQAQSNNALDELTEQRVLLGRYSEVNDTAGIEQVKGNIHKIVAGVAAKRDDFKYNTSAYETYSNSALEFGAKSRSVYDPLVDSAYVKSVKNNQTNANALFIDKSAKAGVPINSFERDNNMQVSKTLFHDDVETLKFAGEVFTHNISSLSSVLDKAPDVAVKDYQLISVDKMGASSYSLASERRMVESLFGDTYTTDEKGVVIAGTSNKIPDAKEMATLASTLGRFRAKIMTPEGSVYSPEFAVAIEEFNKDMTSIDSGSMSPSGLGDTTAANKIATIPDSLLSTDQKHEKARAILKYKNVMSDSNAIMEFALSKVGTANGANDLNIAKVNGLTLGQGTDRVFKVSAERVKSEIENMAQNMDNVVTKAFNSGDVTGILPRINEYNTAYTHLTGKPLPAITKAREITSGGDRGVTNANEYENSLAILLQVASVGGGIQKTDAGSRVIANLQTQMEAIATIKEVYKGDDVKIRNHVNEYKRAGIDQTVADGNRNSISFRNTPMSKLFDKAYNLGTTANLTVSEANAMGLFAAKNGYALTDDTVEDFVNENFERSKLTAFGKVTYRPKAMTDIQFKSVINKIAKDAGVKADQKDYSVRVLPASDRTHNYYTVSLVGSKGQVVRSENYDADMLNLLTDSEYSANPYKNADMPASTQKPPMLSPKKKIVPMNEKDLPPLIFPPQYKKQGGKK